ncbi:TonB-dependent siderophore receptor [Lysobacter yananisis]|uniref:TonB-dependent siderophore receptor n=1 Tax=Lysobacter yananisis TaxID=1003114 RepID=A0ABY9PCL4_9GAMM|nr:TonB-dependent siderophore receptor [Lysobacter yananisis]WMT04823.1 TonB-dependent siderophore receptor [Lysobacter yananisis]
MSTGRRGGRAAAAAGIEAQRRGSGGPAAARLGATRWIAGAALAAFALPAALAQTGAARAAPDQDAIDPIAPADASAGGATPKLLDKVTVESAAAAPWDRPAPTASRLGLSAREIPAAVETLTQEQIQARGLRGSVEALNAAPGVLAGQLPSSPGMASMRGFSGGAIALLYDGVRQSAAPLVTRDFDSWSFERIEVLKGPASVLYGEGALAGAINLVPKRPDFDGRAFSGLVGIGSFGSQRYAVDFNEPVGERLALRAIASHRRSDGYVDGTASEATSATVAARWRPSDAVEVDVALDHFEDDYDTAYWGTPLVPAALARDPASLVRSADGRVLDRSLRRRNYNVDNGLQDSRGDWLRTRVGWQIGEGLRFSNEFSYYDAKRRWWNSETYAFNPRTRLLDRGTTRIEHDHRFWVERATLSLDGDWGGRRNRAAIGAEVSDGDFAVMRRFGTTTAVDPFAPRRGSAGFADTAANFPGAGNRVDFDSSTRVYSVFAEDALNLSERWLLLAGLRYDRIELERRIVDRNTGARSRFERNYEPLSWRVGTVYDLAPKIQLYAQYSTSVAPVGSLPLLSLANSRFELTQGRSAEAGIKSSVWDGRVDLGASAYWIEQDDIVTRDPNNANLSVQGGTQSSRGVELSAAASLTRALRIDASIAALDARFDKLREAGGADRAGNVPPNVPERLAQLHASYRFDALPLTVGAGARYVGPWYADNANRLRVAGRTVWDASVAYRLPFGEIALYGRNLGDALYADWTGGAADQFVLGAPRSVELTLRVNL